MSIGDIGIVFGIVVAVASAQLLLLSSMLGRVEDRLKGKIDVSEATLSGRIDTLSARIDGVHDLVTNRPEVPTPSGGPTT